MKMPFPKVLLLALGLPVALSLSAGLSGCSKEDIPLQAPAPVTSTLAGTTSPLGSVSTVTATAPNGTTFTATPDPLTGNYSLAGLTVGTAYIISFTPTTNYAAPATQTATPAVGTIVVVPAVTLTTASTATAASFTIDFDTQVNGNAFALDTDYTKADGQNVKFSKFKYLFSNIRLFKPDGSSYLVPESYYLFDATVPASKRLLVQNVPVGSYTGMSFIVGVDSARNFSGAQTGVLDSGSDMFWNWNQGYVYLKMEGTSAQSGAQGGALVFHVGGVRNIRTVKPSFGGSTLPVAGGHLPAVHVRVNPLAMFENAANPAANINFVTTYTLGHVGGATSLADNYAAGMFSVDRIEAN
ncbi:hypothetical protein Q5H93_22225 [Hymenobacter sp. ASUV-10]|uniref:Copper-binding protein MbnP-like domain-containing protein n=1 Tax=Hymenobacter aranciens TaxID=3063996 RepID=A0ABT9BGS9_9BACT|nr:MbnP family protein [Hymenobacter sp. ASUV-10]MDO7877472.1 hypothetical protein [Hymenobacter sp. ASUV-10]